MARETGAGPRGERSMAIETDHGEVGDLSLYIYHCCQDFIKPYFSSLCYNESGEVEVPLHGVRVMGEHRPNCSKTHQEAKSPTAASKGDNFCCCCPDLAKSLTEYCPMLLEI